MNKRSVKISPSLLACDFLNLKSEILRAVSSGADIFHADIMDGVYVPNISFGFDIVKSIASVSKIPVDAHLMISRPWDYLDVLYENGVYSVTVHSDSANEEIVIEMLQKIKSLGMKTGLALRPVFPAAEAEKYIELCDTVLVMTVEPGFGGQKFMSDMLPKISDLRDMIISRGLNCSIQVDGGINLETIGLSAKAGADNFVIGTAFFKSLDMSRAVIDFRAAASV